MKKILIGGYYGCNNTGDEAILRAMLDAFQSLRQDLSFNVVSHTPELTEKQHGAGAVSWRDIPALAEAVRQADLVIVGGGGLFQDHWGLDEDSYFRITHGGISTYGTLALLADAFDVPYILHGVGVGPLKSKTAREHTRRIFSQARLATLRDEESLALLEEINGKPLPAHIQLTTDAVFALQIPPEEFAHAARQRRDLGIDRQKPLLGISVRYWYQPQPPSVWIPPLAEAVRVFLRRIQAEALLLPFQIDNEDEITDDLQISRALAREINLPRQTHILERVPGVYEMQALLSGCDLILGMRLHALLMGVKNHIPVVGLAYDPKVTAFMKRAGFAQLTCPLPPRSLELLQMLETAWRERTRFSHQARLCHDTMKSQAWKNIALALQILDSPASKSADTKMGAFLVRRLAQMQNVDQLLRQAQAELQQTQAELQAMSAKFAQTFQREVLLHQKMLEIENSRTYRLARVFQRARNRIVPPRSRREKFLHDAGRLLQRVRRKQRA